MNDIVLSLLIQNGLFLILGLTGIIMGLLENRRFYRKKIFSSLTSSVIFVIAFINFSLFMTRYYSGSIINIKEVLPLFSFFTYSFELGFQISSSQIIIYLTLMFILALSNLYLTWKKPYWKESHSGRLILYALTLNFLIFSSNLFQIMSFVILSDLILIDLIKNLILKSEKRIPDGLRKMITSFFVGDGFLLASLIILARLVKSLDFQIISNNLLTQSDILSKDIQLILSLFLIGIIVKNSLYPFHTWFKEISMSNKDVIFTFLSKHFMITFSLLFISPLFLLLQLQVSYFFIWYGIITALLSVIFSIFLKKELEISILINTIISGILIAVLGLREIAIGFQILITLPILISGLIPYLFIKKTEKEPEIKETRKFNLVFTIIHFFSLVVLSLLFLGIAPLNSTFLILVQTIYQNTLVFNIGLFILFTVIMYGIFILVIKIYKNQIKNSLEFQFSVTEIVYLISLLLFIVFSSFLYPSFNFLNPFDFPLITNLNAWWIPFSIIISGCVIGSIVYFAVLRYFSKAVSEIRAFSTKIEQPLETVYSIDPVFIPVRFFWIRIIVPFSKWFEQIIIKKFLIEFIVLKTWKLFILTLRWLNRTITKIIIPRIVDTFKLVSKFIRKLEISCLRTQFQIVLISLSILLAIILILYSGGLI